jgi:hypothetical protein
MNCCRGLHSGVQSEKSVARMHKDLYQDVTSGTIPGIRRLEVLVVS